MVYGIKNKIDSFYCIYFITYNKPTMSISFNKVMPGEPICISIKNVSALYGRDFIETYVNTIITNNNVKITDILIDANYHVFICFDNWFIRRGETYTTEMEQMSDAFAHGFMYLVPAPGSFGSEFDQDWIFEYVDNVYECKKIIQDQKRREQRERNYVYDRGIEIENLCNNINQVNISDPPPETEVEKVEFEEAKSESESESEEEESESEEEEEESETEEEESETEEEESESDEDKIGGIYILNEYLGITNEKCKNTMIHYDYELFEYYQLDNKSFWLLLIYWVSILMIFGLQFIAKQSENNRCK